MADKVEFTIENVSKVVDKIVKAWQNIAGDIFDLSQVRCPVDEGTLKASGTKEDNNLGSTIKYRTSYAAVQEFGSEFHKEIVTEHTVKKHTIKKHTVKGHTVKKYGVKAHYRKTLVYVTEVKAHDRGPYTVDEFEMAAYDKGPYQKGPFVRYMRARAGKHFLGSSYDEFKPRLARVLVKYIGDVT